MQNMPLQVNTGRTGSVPLMRPFRFSVSFPRDRIDFVFVELTMNVSAFLLDRLAI